MAMANELDLPQVPGRGGRRTERSLARTATWMVELAAATLVLISVGGYLYHRQQLATIATEHLRLMVAGPAMLQAGTAAEYTVSTTAISGQPMQAQVEVALSAADGKRLTAFRETTDEHGRLRVTLPGDRSLPSRAVLKVAASYRESREETEIPLAVEPLHEAAYLTIDKPRCRPGDKLYYRLLVLSGSGFSAAARSPVQFEIRDARGRPVPQSRQEGLTQRGVAGGEFTLPKSLAAGHYTLSAGSRDQRFSGQRCSFTVGDHLLPQTNSPTNSAKPASNPADPTRVTFFPEGGQLVAGLETRVYFTARDRVGRPLRVSGKILAATAEKDRDQPHDRAEKADREVEVAAFETSFRGMGVFAFIPQADRRYRVKITRPAGVKCEAVLPAVSTEGNVVLSTGGGVFAGGAPMEFNVRAAKPGLPLVVAAYCRGVQVGEQPLVTKDGPTGANSVAMRLDDAASGVIRLAVFDYSHRPPRMVAQRLVYRRPTRKLNVRITGQGKLHRPGEPVELSVAVTNEKGEPTPAVLGATVIDGALLKPAGGPASSMPTHFLLTSQVQGPEDLDRADFYLSDQTEGGVPAAVALDLLLGTHGGQQTAEKGRRAVAGKEASPQQPDSILSGRPATTSTFAKGTVPFSSDENWDSPQLVFGRPLTPAEALVPPVMSDNILNIRESYDQRLAAYRTEHRQILHTLTTVSFLGGMGLLLLVAMLGLMRIVWGMHLWIPVLGATACCLIIGAILSDPGREPPNSSLAVPFQSYSAPVPPAKSGGVSANTEAATVKSPEKKAQAASPHDPKVRLPADRSTPLPSSVYHNPPRPSDGKSDHSQVLLWNPMLLTDAEGKASLRFDLPAAAAAFRVRVDAQGKGRLGGGQLVVAAEVAAGPPAKPKERLP